MILTEPHSQIFVDFYVFQILMLKLHFYAKIVSSEKPSIKLSIVYFKAYIETLKSFFIATGS